MCLALPAKVVAIHPDGSATVSIAGLKKNISLALVDGIEVGDYVVVHTGFALSRLDSVEAEKTLAILRSTGTSAQGVS
jgi:hydrogenase expression/formation protein HypC